MVLSSETPQLLPEDFRALPKAIRDEEARRQKLREDRLYGLKEAGSLPSGDENVNDPGTQSAQQTTSKDTLDYLNDLARRAVVVKKPKQRKIVSIGHRVTYRDNRWPEQIFQAIICGSWHDPTKDKVEGQPPKTNLRAPLSQTLIGMKIGDSGSLVLDPKKSAVARITVERIE